MKNEHLSVGIGGGWINVNEVNFHLCFVNGDDYVGTDNARWRSLLFAEV